MNEESLKIQAVDLDLLNKTLEIIHRHNLRYYILGGTLLGAVRHKGFIPWDDDIDIGLPRHDYELFLGYAERELRKPYQLHSGNNSRGEFSYYYARIENTEVLLRRNASLKSVDIPAFLDVFPLDGVPNSPVRRKLWEIRVGVLKRLYSASQFSYFAASNSIDHHRSIPLKILRRLFIVFKIEDMLNTKMIWKALDRALKSNDYDRSDVIGNICGFWDQKEIFPKSVYGDGALYEFEGLRLCGPKNFDYVLSQMYGDYMTPPGLGDREHHYLELIDEK